MKTLKNIIVVFLFFSFIVIPFYMILLILPGVIVLLLIHYIFDESITNIFTTIFGLVISFLFYTRTPLGEKIINKGLDLFDEFNSRIRN